MISFALVGCGRIADRHAELLGGAHIQDAQLSAVCDIKLDKARRLSDKYSVPAFADMDEMMNRIQPDVAVVLTESGNHASNVINLSKYKKHIVVEKPMALRPADADEMIKICDLNSIKLFVVKQNRFNLPIVQLRKALDQGRFGKLVLGTIRVRWCRTQNYYDQSSWRGTWSMDGGVLTNQASHHIDMLSWMMGDVQELYAMAATQLVNIEVEDTALVNLRFRNGALGVIEATTAARPLDQEGSITIMGETGLVEVGGFAMNKIKTWQFEKTSLEDNDVVNLYSTNPPDIYGYGHKSFYEHVVRNLVSESSSLVDGREGRKTVQLINSIYQSIDTNQPIKDVYNQTSSKLGKP